MESYAEAEGYPSSSVLPFKPATNCSLFAVKRDCLSGFKKEVSAAGNRGPWGEKQNQLDQRGNTFWGPIELVRKPY
jgi:hypothetical protein